MNNEPTLQDVLDAVQTLDAKSDQKFLETDNNFRDLLDAVNGSSNEAEKRFTRIDERCTHIDEHFERIENSMATKADLNKTKLDIIDAVDEKLMDLKGDLITIIRKEDNKLGELVSVLRERKLIDDNDIRRVLGMQPFPKALP